jgi:F-type H+-transporting ATPase subunit epsilon
MADAPLIDLELITPEATVLAATPEMVVVPGSEGEFGVLRDHAPILSSLRPGVVQVHATFDAEPECYFVTGGFTEAGPAHCLILADAAVPVSEIDVEAADRAVADAEEAVREAGTGADEAARERTERALEVATARRAAAG